MPRLSGTTRKTAWVLDKMRGCKTQRALKSLVRWAEEHVPESMPLVREALKGRVPC